MINFILCGGAGTRLWPISRNKLPKQFVRIFDGKSLFQKTVERNLNICSDVMVVSGADIYFLAQDQLMREGGSGRFLLEPMGRNTAPAIALASMLVEPDSTVLVTTSDHLIQNNQAFAEAVQVARQYATQGYIATFGIKPDYPETGFGYIEADGHDVLSFREKPDLEVARSYVDQGNYYWNSGMFCFKASVFLSELRKYAPDIHQACTDAVQLMSDEERGSDLMSIDEKAMAAIPSNSIDYAVMEHSKKVKVVPCDIGWSDLGSFDSLYDELSQDRSDSAGNAYLHAGCSKTEPIFVDSQRNLVVSERRQIALVDVQGLLVVDTADALLISKRGSSQQVKEVVSQLKKAESSLTEVHTLAYQPWGSYEVLWDEQSHRVNRVVVQPGQKRVLHNSDLKGVHWIVVQGKAAVTKGAQHFHLGVNEVICIETGFTLQLENCEAEVLIMLEIQVGAYTKKDRTTRQEGNHETA